MDFATRASGWVGRLGFRARRAVDPTPGARRRPLHREGFLSSESADHILQHSDRALREADKVHLFVDGYELDSYDPEIRNAGSAWLKKNATRVVAQHMLVRSRLTKMGLSVVSLALGGLIKGHHERLTFEADLAAAI
jgi:hypothetical protein